MRAKFFRGFTLIELLVVVAIISLLSSVVLTNVTAARNKGKIARAKEDMNQIRTAMALFLYAHNELPPVGDNCSACSNPCSSGWTAVIDPLVSEKFLSAPIYKDPWGNYYCYDDNYRVPACNYDTPLWSMGPNGNRDTGWGQGPPTIFSGDDVGLIIEMPQC